MIPNLPKKKKKRAWDGSFSVWRVGKKKGKSETGIKFTGTSSNADAPRAQWPQKAWLESKLQTLGTVQPTVPGGGTLKLS